MIDPAYVYSLAVIMGFGLGLKVKAALRLMDHVGSDAPEQYENRG